MRHDVTMHDGTAPPRHAPGVHVVQWHRQLSPVSWPYSGMSELAQYHLFIDSYNAHKHKIYNYFYYRVAHDRALAEDLTSDTFLKAYENFETFNTKFAFTTWVFAIARNVLTDYYRKSATRNVEELDEEVPDEHAILFLETLDKHIDLERIRNGLSELPDAQRNAIEMRYFEYREVGEIAERIQADPSAVRKNISRGLTRLREILATLVIFFQL